MPPTRSISGLSDHSVLQIKPTVLFRGRGVDEIQIFNMQNNRIYSASHLGAHLWLQFDGTKNNGQVAKETLKKFSLDTRRFQTMLDKLVLFLFEENLVEILSNPIK